MNEAAQLTKSQRRNAKKREKQNEREKAAAHEAAVEIGDKEALKMEAQRHLDELSKWSRPLVNGRLHEEGEPLVDDDEWKSVEKLMPALTRSLSEAVKETRRQAAKGDEASPIVSCQIKWIYQGDMESPEKERGTPEHDKVRGHQKEWCQLTPGGSGNSIYDLLWKEAQITAQNEKAITNPDGNQQREHEITVKIFRILKKQYKARQRKQQKKSETHTKDT